MTPSGIETATFRMRKGNMKMATNHLHFSACTGQLTVKVKSIVELL